MKTINKLEQVRRKSLQLLMIFLALNCTANAKTTECTIITSIPAVITEQGIYCLKSHLATDITDGSAIEIQADDVIIDFNDFKLGGVAGGENTTAVGVSALQRMNITLRNGDIRGFSTGISLEGASHVIENNRLDGNRRIGISVVGADSIIQGNIVNATGNTSAQGGVVGMMLAGLGVTVVKNQVDGTLHESGEAFGILLEGTGAAIVMYNEISRTEGKRGGYGIYHSKGDYVLIQDNIIINSGKTGSIAILSDQGPTECLSKNNSIMNYTRSIVGCFDSEGNIQPK